MLNLHSTEGLFWMKEWVSPRVSTATRSIPLKAPLALEIKSAPASSAILKSCNLPRGAPPSSVSRFRPQKKWITSASWLVPLLHVFLLYTAMASEEQPAAFSQGARLRDLLRRALSSVDPSEALADAAKKGGVQVIAVDFDMTMIRLHSGGNTSNTPGNPIFTALSRDFDLFATAANSRGIKIAVVTFGDPKAIVGRSGRLAGEPLVRRVLKESAASFAVEGVFPFYPQFYLFPSDYIPLGLTKPMPYNKSFHIRKVCEQFGVTKEEVLLIDDDVNNCAAFVADGGVALRVGGEQGFDLTQLEVM